MIAHHAPHERFTGMTQRHVDADLSRPHTCACSNHLIWIKDELAVYA
ncbi:MAG TPA: hypothetical protein VFN13_12935 [Rudaea sp.]|nr:hypothetical protein [Rudaea sp.]